MDKRKRTAFLDKAYKVSMYVQAFLNALLLLAYVVHFIQFVTLIAGERERLGSLLRQVVVFFTVMLVMLTLNIALDLVFYLKFKPVEDQSSETRPPEDIFEQEKLVSLC